MSPTGAHPSSSSYVSGSANSHSYLGTASESHHHYRPPTALSINSGMSTQHYAPTSSGLPYPVSNPLPSPGFMYSPSSASSSVPGYDAYPSSSSGFPTQHSQYVSYLPPAMGADSRGFYPLNPFEIKHRRRTTKTQFRVLESTFREIPKPNAALRKQISAQLDMPVRAVQIWFQNRRAKAKAVEKKRPAQGQGEERQRGQERYEEARGTGRSMDLPPLRIPNDAVSRQESYASGSSNVTLPSLAGSGSATLRERRAMAGASVTNPAYAEYADRTSALEESTLSAGMPDRNRAAYQRDPRGFDERYRSSS
ncbi:Homeobox domain protein [Kalmanozyma brasiliensis GHG001]|uniref:Homeobox domain-containing protein n=1 Tax=Kalmanozyma brasiliensis (strain GHG001) TaxID=1365824 RepID=V5GM52_KALBG|nr:Homeobox domain protein [Kalmanozyma brasiliensis GHG001]EST07027.1 Homeobox domain protein [Kalmanozyma brasiliensis GHG001]